MNPILSEYSHLNVKILRSKLSEMRSAIGAVLTGLEIQRATVFASDFDDLPKYLSMSRSGIGFLLEPPHRSHHHQHDSDQHDEERDTDGEKIRCIQNNDQD